MRKPMSLRLRVTLLCAALLTLCCLLLTVTNNFSAIRMADAIQAVPLLPAQRAELEDSVSLPMAELHISDTIQQAQGAFRMQSLLAHGCHPGVGPVPHIPAGWKSPCSVGHTHLPDPGADGCGSGAAR